MLDGPACEVSIIGLGPWGLSALERLVHAARGSAVALVVHVVEPGEPGGGMYAQDQPDYLVLNTPCGQHSMYPFPDQVEEGRLGLGFYDWAVAEGYRWQGLECRRSAEGTPISPYDFLPRRLMGEYLEWFYRVLCAEAPANMAIHHHRTAAVDIEPASGGRERVYLADSSQLVVDHVVLTTGHTPSLPDKSAVGAMATRPYPVEAYLDAIAPGEKVAIEGMGLAAMDVLTALTIGLGGSYSEGPGQALIYHPSGREPLIYMFSRSGYPYCAKSSGAGDPMGQYQPAICTMEAVAELKAPGGDGHPRQVDARKELLPLILAEMELRYFSVAAQLHDGAEAAEQARARLLSAWASGRWAAERAAAAARYGDFDAAQHLFVGQGRHYSDARDYQGQVYAEVRDDAHEALVPGGASPVKSALETLRALRDIMRYAIEFKGLTLSSHLDFMANMQSRFARLVAGPPVFRSQQMLALMDAGVLHIPFGPAPEVLPQMDGQFRLRSTQLAQPYDVVVPRLVRAHLDLPSVARTASPLLTNLAQRGRVRPLQFNGTPVGSVDIDEQFHPVGRSGQPEARLWVFGVLSEGARYFTMYIPSPKSRARAFVDAEVLARAVTGAPGTAGPAAEPSSLGRPSVGGRGRQRARPPAAQRPAPPRFLRLALVNNMPDAAFEETDRQFVGLLSDDALPGAVSFERYSLPGITRGAQAMGMLGRLYKPLEELYTGPPDAVVLTGAKPKQAELSEELYWPALDQLLRWCSTAVPSAIVSCLSAHAALWAFDGLARRLLLEKCSGVFAQSVDESHPLTSGMGPFAVPHSRFNEVPTESLEQAGYRVVSRSPEAGWTVAVGTRGACEFTLLQGHPEYQRLTLLREYRRDVRSYLLGNQGSYPHLPTGYFEDDGLQALLEFQGKVSQQGREPTLMDGFPYDVAAQAVKTDWERPSRVLMANWLASVRQRAGLGAYSESGA